MISVYPVPWKEVVRAGRNQPDCKGETTTYWKEVEVLVP
jgi:hypothetical protein